MANALRRTEHHATGTHRRKILCGDWEKTRWVLMRQSWETIAGIPFWDWLPPESEKIECFYLSHPAHPKRQQLQRTTVGLVQVEISQQRRNGGQLVQLNIKCVLEYLKLPLLLVSGKQLDPGTEKGNSHHFYSPWSSFWCLHTVVY